ncbi:MAG: phosphoribosyltransferase family protein [Bacteroidia bacterium]|nr:phosphoribosyltransferase family protein [Bacteroidia bacterium]
MNQRVRRLMSEITIHDKVFRLYLRKEQIEARIVELARELNAKFDGEAPVILPVLKGGHRFWSSLAPQLRFAYELDFIKMSSYGKSLIRERLPKFDLVHIIPTTGRHVLIVEDIVDRGVTAQTITEVVRREKPASVFFASLFFKPDAFVGAQKPDWIGFAIENKFVVGFGLDYNERGRHLSDLYQIAE